MIDGIPSEVEGSEALGPGQDVWLHLGDGVVFQVKRQQTGHQSEGPSGETSEAVLLQVEVSQLRETCEFGLSKVRIMNKVRIMKPFLLFNLPFKRPLKALGLREVRSFSDRYR